MSNRYSDSKIIELIVNPKTRSKGYYLIKATKEGDRWDYITSIVDNNDLDAFNEIEVLLNISKKTKCPTEFSSNSRLYTSISNTLNEGKEDSKNIIKEALKEIEKNIYDKIATVTDKIKENEVQQYQTVVDKGRTIYTSFKKRKVNVPQFIASVSRWLVAEEEGNVIKLLLAIMNTAKGEATNIISESASGTGKTHIENTAFSLVHSRHYTTVNFSTTPAFRNECIADPDMFKNKMVRLGDMGSEANQEVMAEVMGILKILNSEGIYEANKMAGDGETILRIVLNGRTGMCYSKVANNLAISEQDSSRGITYSPNPSNQEAFEKFALWKNTPDFKNNHKELVDEYVEQIKDYMEFIIDCDIEVINPYQKQIARILKNNKTYRRTLGKELWLLNSITLLNLPNKKIYEIGDRKFIYVSVEDVMNYVSLYKKDLIVKSSFDLNMHGLELYLKLREDYEALIPHDADQEFANELQTLNTDCYDEHIFAKSKRFFTINHVLLKYEDTIELNNLVSEVRNKNDKLRKVFVGMKQYIGRTSIPSELFSGNIAPTLYYVIDVPDKHIIDEITLDKETLYLFQELGLDIILDDVVDDFVSVASKSKSFQSNDKVYIDINSLDCDILKHHEDVKVPPFIQISKESKQAVKSLWNDKLSSIPKEPKEAEFKKHKDRRGLLA